MKQKRKISEDGMSGQYKESVIRSEVEAPEQLEKLRFSMDLRDNYVSALLNISGNGLRRMFFCLCRCRLDLF